MEYLFSYGTLQQKNVQLETFGRVLKGQNDSLPKFIVSEVRILDSAVINTSNKEFHPILQFTDNADDTVDGIFFEITHTELIQADTYEVEQYKRVRGLLSSGIEVWMYVDATDSRLG